LAIALGISNIALKEVSFSTSAKDSNNASLLLTPLLNAPLFYDRSTKINSNSRSIHYHLLRWSKCAGNIFRGDAIVFKLPFGFRLLLALVPILLSPKDTSTGTTVTSIDSKKVTIPVTLHALRLSTSLLQRELLYLWGSEVVRLDWLLTGLLKKTNGNTVYDYLVLG